MRILTLFFSLILCSVLASASVVMTHFEAMPGDNSVSFSWGTSSETQNYFFEITRNDTGVTQITGHGTTTEPHEYSWVDHGVQNENTYRYTLWATGTTGQDSLRHVTVIPPHWVALGTFTAQGGNHLVQLSWQALSEYNNQRFDISRNGTHVGTVNGHGNNMIPHNYFWVDTTASWGASYTYVLWAVNFSSAWDSLRATSVTLAVDDPVILQPSSFSLSSYPNPFNPTTTLSFTLPSPERVRLEVFDLAGRECQVLASSLYAAGEHHLTWDASALPSGIYFAKLTSGSVTATRKLLLLK